ncbi:WD40-repeat-containing domain protein [Mycena alexandri]|uniref:WD40-repeat-containing domain protein n=1 Tax=Mycena alexandri TaxID=1745969 RepID=A0AAD6T1L0_9AGAR|nr:WD40-repeat-containing domain protein [Mycena alexandri]
MPSPSEKPNSKNQNYALHGALQGHSGAVVCLGATEDGKLLASGASDGTRLWNLENMTAIARPAGAGIRGATTALLWVRREDEAAEVLFFGTHRGFLVCWKQTAPSVFEELHTMQVTQGAEITGLAFDPASNRLTVCNRDSVVQAYTVERPLTLHNLFSVTIGDFVPKAIAFGEFRNNEAEIMVFGLYDGRVITLRSTTGAVLATRQIGGMIGDADVNARKGLFCVDDPTQGVALYRLDNNNRVKTFEVKVTKTHPRARQVCFADDGSVIVSGSDHGVLYIFDRWTGEAIDELAIGPVDWLQTVTATDVNGVSTILAARSRELAGGNEILVWKRAKAKKPWSVPAAYGQLLTAMHALVVLGAIIFLYQKLKAFATSQLVQ